MRELWQAHVYDVAALQCLAFAVLGAVVAVLPRKDAALPFAKDLWLVAPFGVLHGAYALIALRIPIPGEAGALASWLSTAWLLISYLPLFEFGRRLVCHAGRRNDWRIVTAATSPAVAYGASACGIAVLTLWAADPVLGVTAGARFFQGSPAALLTAAGFVLVLRGKGGPLRLESTRKPLWFAAVAIAFYGLVMPVLPRMDANLPAWLPTAAGFLDVFGVPVAVTRTAAAIGMTIGIAVTVFHANWGTRQLGNQLRDSEQRLAEAQRLAKIGSWELDIDSKTLHWSDEIYRIFEVDKAGFTVSYDAFLAAIHPEDRAAVNAAYTRSLVTRVPYEITHRLRMPDGRVKFVQERCETYYGAGGKAVRSVGTVQDITERMAAERAVQESQRRQQSILDSMFVFVGVFALDGTILDVNRSPLEAGGLQREDVIGKKFWDTGWISHSSGNQELVRSVLGRAARGETVRVDLAARVASGEIRDFDSTFSPLRDASGGVIQVVGSGVDITERKRAEVEVRRQRDFAERLVATAPVIVLLLDRTGAIQHINPYLEQLSGYRLEDVRGLDWFETLLPERDRARIRSLFQTATEGDLIRGYVNAIVTRAGVEREIEWNSSPMRNEQGEIVTVLAIGLDVTERRRAEAQLRESEYRLRGLLENAPIIVYSVDKNGVFTASEGRELATVGRRPGEVVGQSAFAVFGHLPERMDALRRGLRGESFTIEVQVDGHWFESRHQPILDAEGRVDGMVIVSTNVTDRHRAEAEAEAGRRRLSAVLGSISDGFFTLDREWVYRYVNENAARFVGKTPPELLNRRIWDVFPQAEGSVWHQRYRQVMESQQPVKFEDYYEQLGRWYEAAVYPFEDGISVYFLDVTDRKRASLAVAESRERLATTLRSIGDAVITTDVQGRVDNMNPVAERLTGWTLAEARGRLLPEVFHIVNEDTRAEVESPVDRVLREGEIVGLANHTALIARDGRDRPIADSGAPIRGDDGKLLGVVLVFRDQTEERRAEATLRESETRYRRIVENSKEGIFIVDGENRVIYLNGRMAEMLGYRPEQVLGRMISEFVAPEEQADWQARVAHRKQGVAERFERTYVRADGSLLPVELSSVPTLDEAGNYQGSTNLVLDIGDRKRAEAALRESEARYRRIVENNNEGIFTVDANYRISFVNPRMAEMLGYPAAELLGRPIIDFVTEEERADGLERQRRGRMGISARYERRYRKSDGSLISLQISSVPMLDAAGDFQGTTNLVLDITDRKRAEEALRRSEEQRTQAVRVARIGIFDHDHRSNTIYWSPEQRANYGFGPDEPVTLEAFLKCVYPDDLAAIGPAVQRAHDPQGDGSFDVVHRIVRRDGQVRWLDTRSQTFFEGEGSARRPVRTVGAVVDVTDRYRAQHAIAENRERLATTLRSIGDAVIATDTAGRVNLMNPVAERLTGWTQAEAAGRPLPEVFHIVNEDTRAEVESPVNRVLRDGQIVGLANHTALIARDGSDRPITDSGAPIRTEDGRMLGVVLVFRDQTEERRAEAALNQFKTTLDLTLDCVFMFDPHTLRFFYLNQGALDQVGYTMQEMMGMTPLHIKPEFDQSSFSTLIRPLVSGEQKSRTFETVHRRKDGREIPVEIFLQYIHPSNERPRFVALARDMTERKRAQAALRESEARYRRIVENNNEGIFSVDADYRISFVNPRMCEMLGYEAAELLGRPVLDLVAEEERADGLERQRRRRQGVAERHERRYRKADGSFVTVQLSSVPVFDDAGNFAGVTNMAVDITEKRNLEQQFLQSQKMEAVGRLAGGVAHDFNNLLTVILGYSAMLQRKLAAEDPLRSYVDQMVKAGERSRDLTRSLLAFSRHQTPQLQVLGLGEIVSNMEPMLRRVLSEDIEMVTHLERAAGNVRVDAGQMEQVIMNLVVNARDAMPKGGRLTIEVAREELTSSYAETHLGVQPGRYVRMAVTDTGTGMSKEALAHLFEPFFTTKPPGKGTGLGLSTVYGIVRNGGGHVWVYSEEGHGTTFKVYLPEADGGESATLPSEPAVSAGGSETVLLVEDDESVRDMVRIVLQESGYRVMSARSAADALEQCKTHAGKIHLLLTDMVMPAVGGRELADQVSRLHPGIKVIFMSGYTEDTALSAGNVPAGARFLQKPVLPDVLKAQVRQALDG